MISLRIHILFYIKTTRGPPLTVCLSADNTVVYLTISEDNDCHNFQEDLHKLAKLDKLWEMELHSTTCSVLTVTKKKNPGNSDYKLHNHTLEHEVSTIYQNCFIKNDQDLVEDINHLSVKASRCLGFLHRNLNINSKSIKWLAYKTFVKAQMEFDTTVWDATHF